MYAQLFTMGLVDSGMSPRMQKHELERSSRMWQGWIKTHGEDIHRRNGVEASPE